MRAARVLSSYRLAAHRAGQLKLRAAVRAAHVVLADGALAAGAEELPAAAAKVLTAHQGLPALRAELLPLQAGARGAWLQPAARAIVLPIGQGKLADGTDARPALGAVPGAGIVRPAATGTRHQANVPALHGDDVCNSHGRAYGNFWFLPASQARAKILRQGHPAGGAVSREQRLAVRADFGAGG